MLVLCFVIHLVLLVSIPILYAIDLSRNDSSHGLPRSAVAIKNIQNRQAGIGLTNDYLKHSIVFNLKDH